MNRSSHCSLIAKGHLFTPLSSFSSLLCRLRTLFVWFSWRDLLTFPLRWSQTALSVLLFREWGKGFLRLNSSWLVNTLDPIKSDERPFEWSFYYRLLRPRVNLEFASSCLASNCCLSLGKSSLPSSVDYSRSFHCSLLLTALLVFIWFRLPFREKWDLGSAFAGESRESYRFQTHWRWDEKACLASFNEKCLANRKKQSSALLSWDCLGRSSEVRVGLGRAKRKLRLQIHLLRGFQSRE